MNDGFQVKVTKMVALRFWKRQGFLKEVGNQVKVTKMVALRLGSCKVFRRRLEARQTKSLSAVGTEIEPLASGREV